MRLGRGMLVAAALCGLSACGPAAPPVTEAAVPEGWQQVIGGPLSPREQALGLWTGTEVLLLGGSNSPPCPPNASCAVDPTPVTDAAALDPAANRWRALAPPPVPLLGAQGVTIGPTAYVLADTTRREVLVYRVDKDSWTRLPAPFDRRSGYELVDAGDRLVAYRNTDEFGSGPDYVLDPATTRWNALPDDPLGAAFSRTLEWSGRELLLFDHELVPNPNGVKPSLTRVAALNLGTGTWRRLPDAPMLSTGPWLRTGGGLVNPAPGGADGGQVNNWGRTYPNGGLLDPGTGRWSPLPDPPGGEELGAGVRTATTALYPTVAEAVLDTESGAWAKVPDIPGGDASGRTVVAAGVRMVVFGGAQWKGSRAEEGKLLDTTWIWTP